MTSTRLAALSLAAALAAAPVALAQNAPPPPPGPRMAQPGWGGPDMAVRMQEHHARRLRALHDVLGIRPDQEAAFAAFAAAMRPEGMPPRAPDHAMAMGAMTLPQRLDMMQRRMDERQSRRREAFARREAAAKALYAALSPEQQRAMDALPMLRGGGGMGHGRPGMGMERRPG